MPAVSAHQTCLVPLDTEGDWNRPLLENAAAMSGAGCVYATSDSNRPRGGQLLDEVLGGFEHVIACEAVHDAVSIYGFPAPRGKTAVIVGNEEHGIPRMVLKRADRVTAVPMSGRGMSSINVAVSAAISLYVFTRDMGRRRSVRSDLVRTDVDLLIHAPRDPHETGSLLRSVWAFGWRRVFVSDTEGVWFTRDRQKAIEGRAAARRSKNPLAVLPVSQLDADRYDEVVLCDNRRAGTPLSGLRLPSAGRLLLVYGLDVDRWVRSEGGQRVFVDHVDTGVEPRFRHAGSILLSVIAESLRG